PLCAVPPGHAVIGLLRSTAAVSRIRTHHGHGAERLCLTTRGQLLWPSGAPYTRLAHPCPIADHEVQRGDGERRGGRSPASAHGALRPSRGCGRGHGSGASGGFYPLYLD